MIQDKKDLKEYLAYESALYFGGEKQFLAAGMASAFQILQDMAVSVDIKACGCIIKTGIRSG